MIHFYHLHALDWVDVTKALEADAARLRRSQPHSRLPNNSATYFRKCRIQ